MAPSASVIGYARVSTGEQAENGYGLAAQEAAITSECARRGWPLLGVVRDEGVSGASLGRPGLRRALERIRDGEADTLVVAKLDRLSRSVGDFALLLDQAEREGYRLVVLDPPVDMTELWGRAVAQMSSVFAELERALTSQRTRDGLAAARAAGRPISRPAVADVPELRARIVAMRSSGMTLGAIADVLNAERVPTLRGGERWRASSLQAALGYERRPARRRYELPERGQRRQRFRREQS